MQKNTAAAADFVKQCPRRLGTIATLGRQVPPQPGRLFVRDHRVESVALNAVGPDSICPFSAARISAARTLRASQD